ILMGFSDTDELQILHAILFLLTHMTALMGNILIITLTSLDQHLSTPMYFFLKQLCFSDSCFISVIVPKSIINSITHTRCISFLGCATQLFLVLYLAFSELALLTVMACDHYMAICHLLHYEVIMTWAASWLSEGIGGMYTSTTLSLTFCGFLTQQFFWDVPSLMKISCVNTHLVKTVMTAIIFFLVLRCFISIIASYTYILIAVLRIPSTQGRSKVFLTCLPHLLLMTLFFSTVTAPYLIPKSDNPFIQDLLLSVFYPMVSPTLNPIIYSLRNKYIKDALRKILLGKIPLHFNYFIHEFPVFILC
uniref:G-protein coupled receptors family 1 profile domain-containing protein n=1 Tax=Loxodonta africana TaxID=9785 RepID=G3U904_LOXAF